MPKQKNEVLYMKVVEGAHKLFLEKGYNDTSYLDIAEYVGLGKNLVQYYFPKKHMLALSLSEKLLHEITIYIKDNKLERDNVYINLLLVGQIYFSFLLKDDKTKKFTMDILKDRALTETLLLFDYDWGMKYLNIDSMDMALNLQDDIIYAMGGFYELLYTSLHNNSSMNIHYYLSKVICAIMESIGYNHGEAIKLIENTTPFGLDYDSINSFLEKSFYTI